MLRDARRALLIRLRSLGDAVLMTPVPTALKTWRPSLHVTVLVEEPYAAVFRRHPAVDQVLCLPHRSTLRERLECAAALRRSGFELVFNMHSGSTAGLLTALTGAPLRVAYTRARFAAACHVRVPTGARREHTVLHQLRPLAHLGIPVPERPELQLNVDAGARSRVAQQMKEHRLRAGQYIVMQPFSNWVTKQWQPARFAALARELRDRYALPILVLAGPSETRRLEQLLALADGTIAALRDVPVAELIAWIERCALVVGNDSGPAHVAAALGKRNVVIFGSADPEVWRPWAGRHEMLLPNLPCIPCAGDRCYEFEAPRCIESITVEQVLDAVARIERFDAGAGRAISSPPRAAGLPG